MYQRRKIAPKSIVATMDLKEGKELLETCLNWCGDRAFISTDDRGLISRCLAGIKKHPDECKIIALPEQNDGCLYFSCPVDFGKRAIRNMFPAHREPMDETQRAAAAARLQAARQKKK